MEAVLLEQAWRRTRRGGARVGTEEEYWRAAFMSAPLMGRVVPSVRCTSTPLMGKNDVLGMPPPSEICTTTPNVAEIYHFINN